MCICMCHCKCMYIHDCMLVHVPSLPPLSHPLPSTQGTPCVLGVHENRAALGHWSHLGVHQGPCHQDHHQVCEEHPSAVCVCQMPTYISTECNGCDVEWNCTSSCIRTYNAVYMYVHNKHYTYCCKYLCSILLYIMYTEPLTHTLAWYSPYPSLYPSSVLRQPWWAAWRPTSGTGQWSVHVAQVYVLMNTYVHTCRFGAISTYAHTHVHATYLLHMYIHCTHTCTVHLQLKTSYWHISALWCV